MGWATHDHRRCPGQSGDTEHRGHILRRSRSLPVLTGALYTFVIDSTLIYLLFALLAFALVGRKASHPVRFYRILALVALFVSFLFPVQALIGLFPAPGMNLHILWTMIMMHTVTATITVSLLTRLSIEP